MTIVLEYGGWAFMLLPAIAISGYAFVFFSIENLGSPVLKAKFALTPLTSYAHIIGGGIALLIGPFQLNSFLRDRYLFLYRMIDVSSFAPIGFVLSVIEITDDIALFVFEDLGHMHVVIIGWTLAPCVCGTDSGAC